MTFTEAAVEVLRRAGKPLHFKEIAEAALRENLLSHVGQDPEITMGQRLAAMAKREDDRKVVAVTPEGTFALIEWAVPQDFQIQAVAPPMQPAETGEPLYRPREREPRAIHAQARRRLAELQAEHEEGYEEVEAERRRQDLGRKGQRRFPPPAEVVFEALAQRQTGAVLAELAADLLRRQLLSEALVRDLPSLVAALLEDNRRRTEAGRKPVFIVDGDRVTLVRGGREIGRADVQELRKDLAHYSAQMGLVLSPGEAGRDARSEASAAGQAPVALYTGEALPEEMIACRVGVTVQTVEVPDLDEAFFAGLLRHREDRGETRDRRREREERPAAPQEEAAAPPPLVAESAASGTAGGIAEPEAVAAEEVPPEDQPSAESPPPGAEGEEPREARRRRGREERSRATSPAEQAWGQPAGTMRFAPPPGPTVVSPTTTGEEEPPGAEPAASTEEPAASTEEPAEAPQTPKTDPF